MKATMSSGTALNLPQRVLLGPGPSELDPAVLRAMSLPQLGHVDPVMLDLLAEIRGLLQSVFCTDNKLTLALSGTGTSGMQAALANTIEPGDPVVIGSIGYFGDRLANMAARLGAKVTSVEAEWGQPLDPDRLRETVRRVKPRVVGLVHGETSTGVVQNDTVDLAAIAHEADALVILDTVASLGGAPIRIDEAGIDVCYSGSQKALGAPSGMAPLTLNERAIERLRQRQAPVTSFYLDALALEKYWGEGQYHHTISAPLVYALHAALAGVMEEGLAARWARHRRHYAAFRAAIEAMGMRMLSAPEHSLHTVAGVLVPEAIDAVAIKQMLLDTHNIVVATGLGSFRNRMLRIGLMGYGSQPRFVMQLVRALENALTALGHRLEPGVGLVAAQASWRSADTQESRD
jgi:alanine-glyoxylate transaminase/serine-glyoxylate transaminase/serine-pyruvate transaminase